MLIIASQELNFVKKKALVIEVLTQLHSIKKNLHRIICLSLVVSLDEQDDDMAAEWLQMAGLSDLVTDPSLNRPGNSVPRESLSSMTVLLTLTRPQREAVLRRITSFKRSHVS